MASHDIMDPAIFLLAAKPTSFPKAEIGAIPSYGHGFQKRGRMTVHRVLQCLDGRFPIYHLNFEIRHNAVKFLL